GTAGRPGCPRRPPVGRRPLGNLIGLRFRRTVSSLRARREIRPLMLLRIIEPGLSPELAGNLNGVDAGRLPPGLLVAGAMDRAVMRAAEGHGEFVTRFAAKRPRLQVAKMMRIRLVAGADETCLLGDITQVLPVTIAPRSCKDEHALVDAVGLVGVAVSLYRRCMGAGASEINMNAWSIVCGFRALGRCELG